MAKQQGMNPELLWVSKKTPQKSMDVYANATRSNEWMYWAEMSKQQCIQNKLITEMLEQLSDCSNIAWCINWQLWELNAWLLTNFTNAVVAAYEAHIALWGWDPEFCGEVLACFQNPTVALTATVLDMINDALATSPNPILSNLCSYINDCIDNWLLAVSSDAGNLITIGTDGWAFLETVSAINVSYDNTTSGLTATNVQAAIDELLTGNNIELYEDATDTWIRYTKANGDLIDLKTGHAETITPVANVVTTITHNLGTNKILVQVYDSVTWEMVQVEVLNRTATTVDIISTTVDDIEVIIKR